MYVYNNGTNVVDAVNHLSSLTLASALPIASGGTGSNDTTYCNLQTNVNGVLPVGNGGTGVNTSTGTGSTVLSASPTFTGTPLAPTAAVTTDNTQIATTAFVRDIIPAGLISLWSGSSASIPTGWLLCDGSNSTPDLRNRFIVGAGGTYAVGATGGSADAIVVSHTHTATSTSSVTDPGHLHDMGAIRDAGPYGSTTITGQSLEDWGSANFSTQSANVSTKTTNISVATSTTVASAGSSGTNANLPPYYALCYIMKT